MFRIPAHPRYLQLAVRNVVPVIRHTIEGARPPGGIVGAQAFVPALRGECVRYRGPLPARWRGFALPPRRIICVRPVTVGRGQSLAVDMAPARRTIDGHAWQRRLKGGVR